jgi:hypothetical protein
MLHNPGSAVRSPVLMGPSLNLPDHTQSNIHLKNCREISTNTMKAQLLTNGSKSLFAKSILNHFK